MNINIKKIYYALLIVLLLSGSVYYAYTHEIIKRDDSDTLLQNNNTKEKENKVGENNKNIFNKNGINENLKNDKIVYETEVDSKNECTSFEKFNNEAKTCYYECADEKECTAIENKINTELESWVDEESIKEANKNKTSENEKGLTDENMTVQFLVNKGEKINFKFFPRKAQGYTDYYFTVWNKIAALSPDDISDKYIEEFDIYENSKDDTIAFVDDEDGNGKWRIAINDTVYRKQNEREQYMSLIHELAHIISLNKDQMEFAYSDESNGSEKCLTLSLDEGCLKKESYLNLFYNRFYNKTWGQKEEDIEKIKDSNVKKFDDTFINDYAATNEVEDFAESFTYFVVDSYNYERQNLKDKEIKIASMYNYAELVKIREQMRDGLNKELLKEQKRAELLLKK